MTDSPTNETCLELETMIGFGGCVPRGLHVHPDGDHLLYPTGCTVVIEDIGSKKQVFLSGHTSNVSCLAVSKSGCFIASGQSTHMGFKADVIIWDYNSKRMYCKLTLHRNNVEALAFSPNDKYLVSLGGQDDGSVVVWNLATKEAICGSPAQVESAGHTHALCFHETCDHIFFSGGDGTLRQWELDLEHRKIWPTGVSMGQLKRVVRCLEMSEGDFFYCGTTSGDIMAVNKKSNNFQVLGPEKGKFGSGVTALALVKHGQLLVGAGDGSVALVKSMENKFKRTDKIQKVEGAVTSIALRGPGHQFFVGTDKCNIYRFKFSEFTTDLITTCHYAKIHDLAFASGYSDLVATCSKQDIRLWNLKKGQELLRISVPNMTCNAIAIMRDGSSIISGWDDGRIRAFYPESGKPMYTIENAYGGSVTALATYSSCTKVMSGSNLGHVVVWSVPATQSKNKNPQFVTDHFLLKEHKAAVTCIKIKGNDEECVTSSTDGSCIIWNLSRKCRQQMIRVNTLFKYICYHPDENQIITTGTDRKMGYWETFDGSMIREVEGSINGSVNTMDISTAGTYFVSGGDDKMVKVWKYDEGMKTHIGTGHSAPITGCKISPDEGRIVSVSEDGAILIWKFPFNQSQYHCQKAHSN